MRLIDYGQTNVELADALTKLGIPAVAADGVQLSRQSAAEVVGLLGLLAGQMDEDEFAKIEAPLGKMLTVLGTGRSTRRRT